MKRIFLACVLGLFAIVAVNAQSSGIKVGINFANQAGEGENGELSTGFHIGFFNEFEISESFFFTPGLNYSQKGMEGDDVDSGIKVKLILNYIEVPLDFSYKADLGTGNVYFSAGPYLAYAINSKIKAGSVSVDGDEVLFGEDGIYKRMDFGLNVGSGLEFSGFRVGAQYGLGLANIFSGSGGTIKNRLIGLYVGYKFSR